MTGLISLILALVPAASPGDSVFVARSVTGPPVNGTITRIDVDGTITLAGEAPVSVAGADLISLRRRNVPLPSPPIGPHLIFASGDRLAGEVLAIENGRVRFRALVGLDPAGDGAVEISIPLSALAVLWLHPPPADASDELNRRWANERRRRDIVRTRNGDERISTIKELKSPTAPLQLEEEGGRETSVDAGLVAAIAMNTDLARTLRPRGPFFRLVLANGGRLSVLNLTAGAVALSARTLFGSEIKIPLNHIVSIDRWQGRAVFLSDLKPARFEHRPFLGVRWPFALDRSVAGNDLRLTGHSFDKGIGLHSESRLTFALNGGYQRFESLVGLDERTGQGGRVVVRVLVDGKPRDLGFEELSSAIGPRPVVVDVNGARELTLVVEFGPAGDVRDHVNWVEAMLIR